MTCTLLPKPLRFSPKAQHFYRKALLLLLILAGLSSCGRSDYARLIPADAALVVRSNLKAVAEEAGGMDRLARSAAASGNPLLTAVAKDPDGWGIDFGQDTYLYATLNRDEPTLLFALADEDQFIAKLEELNAQGLCDKVQQGTPFRWAAFPGKGLCAIGDGFAAYVYAPLTPPDNLLARLRELQGQEEQAAFVSQKEYKRLEAQSGSTRFYLSLQTLPNTAAVASVLGMPFQMSAEDLRVCGSFSYKPGLASLKAELYSDKAEVQDFLERQSLELHALSGKYFSYLSDNLLACVALKLDGDGAEKIEALPEVGPALSTLAELSGIDATRFLDSFSGDFLLGLHAPAGANPMPGVTCYAESADKGTRQILQEAFGKDQGFFGPVVRRTAPDQYEMRFTPEMSVRLGLKDQDFYLTTVAGKPFETPAHPLNKADYSALRSGKLIAYLLVCPAQLQGGNELVDEYVGANASLLSKIRAVELAARPGRKVEINVYLPQ